MATYQGRRPWGSAARPAGTRPDRCRGGSRCCPSRRWRPRGRASCRGSRPRRRCSTARCRRRRAPGSRSRPRRRRGRSRSWCRRRARRRGRACRLGSDPRSLPSAARQRGAASRPPRRRPERPPLRRPRGARTQRSSRPPPPERDVPEPSTPCRSPPHGHVLLGTGTVTSRRRSVDTPHSRESQPCASRAPAGVRGLDACSRCALETFRNTRAGGLACA